MSTPSGQEVAGSASDPASGGDKTADAMAREHELQQLLHHRKAKQLKMFGLVFGVPLALFVLGLATGVISVSEKSALPETCADISDRDLCQASKAECCYNGITHNCTELAECDPVCSPGFESFANLGVEPCIACEPGWADTDEDPTTPCAPCDPGTYAGTESIECALCDRGTADTDRDAATLCAPSLPLVALRDTEISLHRPDLGLPLLLPCAQM
jgi:hypothetical protein